MVRLTRKEADRRLRLNVRMQPKVRQAIEAALAAKKASRQSPPPERPSPTGPPA
jgi:hypothetical protein